MLKHSQPEQEPSLISTETACKTLNIGRSKLYQLIREKQLNSVKIGKLTRITMVSLKNFLENLPAVVTGDLPIKHRNKWIVLTTTQDKVVFYGPFKTHLLAEKWADQITDVVTIHELLLPVVEESTT